jgi:hypothetical protein
VTVRQRREEFARRGDEIYESQIRPQVETDNNGKIVAIDIETGNFELAGDTMNAIQKLLDRLPNIQTWVGRISHQEVVHRFLLPKSEKANII